MTTHHQLVRAAPDLAVLDAAKKDVVHVHGAAQGVWPVSGSHGLPQLVQYGPGGLAVDARLLAQFQGGDAPPALGVQENRQTPLSQRDLAAVEDRNAGADA